MTRTRYPTQSRWWKSMKTVDRWAVKSKNYWKSCEKVLCNTYIFIKLQIKIKLQKKVYNFLWKICRYTFTDILNYVNLRADIVTLSYYYLIIKNVVKTTSVHITVMHVYCNVNPYISCIASNREIFIINSQSF